MAEAENLLWEQDFLKEQSGDRQRGEQATSLGLPDMEAASAWGGPASVRGSAYGCLIGALGSLRRTQVVCVTTARSPRGQKCSISDFTEDSRFCRQCLLSALAGNGASSPFHQRLVPSSSLVVEMFLCTCSPGFLFTYLFLLPASLLKKSLASCAHDHTSQSTAFSCMKPGCLNTGLRQNHSRLTCMCSLSLRDSLCC